MVGSRHEVREGVVGRFERVERVVALWEPRSGRVFERSKTRGRPKTGGIRRRGGVGRRVLLRRRSERSRRKRVVKGVRKRVGSWRPKARRTRASGDAEIPPVEGKVVAGSSVPPVPLPLHQVLLAGLRV